MLEVKRVTAELRCCGKIIDCNIMSMCYNIYKQMAITIPEYQKYQYIIYKCLTHATACVFLQHWDKIYKQIGENGKHEGHG